MSKENKSDESQEEVEIVEDGNAPSESEQGKGENDAPSVEEVWDPEKALAQALEEVADLRDKMLRAAAENENFKKRMARERSASLKYAGEQILREMLPVVDNLKRAIDQGEAGGDTAGKNLESFVEGVKLTLKNLVATLEKFEVKSIESIGEPFDPKHHEALTMEASDTVPANHVLNEFEKGYYYKDRLLRAAKVIVSSGNA